MPTHAICHLPDAPGKTWHARTRHARDRRAARPRGAPDRAKASNVRDRRCKSAANSGPPSLPARAPPPPQAWRSARSLSAGCVGRPAQIAAWADPIAWADPVEWADHIAWAFRSPSRGSSIKCRTIVSQGRLSRHLPDLYSQLNTAIALHMHRRTEIGRHGMTYSKLDSN